MRGYASVYDPGVWIAHARMMKTESGAAAYRAVYYALRADETAVSINRIANLLSVDLRRFDRLTAQLQDTPSTEERHENRLALHVLHAVRQALMMRAFALTGRLPRLSERHDASARDVVNMIAEMRFAEVVELLSEIFPRARASAGPDRTRQPDPKHVIWVRTHPQGHHCAAGRNRPDPARDQPGHHTRLWRIRLGAAIKIPEYSCPGR